MKYIDYKEHRQQGTFNFPIAYYHQTPHSPRYYMPYHWHTEYELIQINDGEFHMTMDDNTESYKAGDVIFIPAGTIHGGTPSKCQYDCVVFDMSLLSKGANQNNLFISNILNHKVNVNTLISTDHRDIADTVTSLCNSLAERKPGYEYMVQGYLLQVMGLIMSNSAYSVPDSPVLATERLKAIKDVLDYISENYYNFISLDDLAGIAGMNPKYFCRYFKSVTERTPIDYLNYYRIESACEMLSTRDISIKEAAISCGFNDESYFIKTFHKYKGITPKQFTRTSF
ncbi:MAG: AraC family transcriptional regulator [Lachnospiraceae bacterium]|nr:AraC family transcriptional regulator [Lachnospiraceae bacterium]